MGRKKPPPEPPEDDDVNSSPTKSRSTDRHKSKKVARIPDRLYEALNRLAARNDRPWTWELMRAIRAYLEANGEEVPRKGGTDRES